jgi:hypothetical protein
MEEVCIEFSGSGYGPVAALVNIIVNLVFSEEFTDCIKVYLLPKNFSVPRN